MFERETSNLHTALVKKFKRVGEHSDWVKLDDAAFSGQHRFLRQTAIGDNLTTDLVQYSPASDSDISSARLECIVEDRDGATLSGQVSTFHTNQLFPRNNEIRSGKSGINEHFFKWNKKSNYIRRLKVLDGMVKRVIAS